MIAVKLMGGLGNQMFQYAIARAHTKHVTIDFSFLQQHAVSSETFTSRFFGLNVFPNIVYKPLKNWQRTLYLRESYIPLIERFREWLGLNCLVVRQHENEFVSVKPGKNLYFDGYFQSEKYFSQIRNGLLHDFSFPPLDKRNAQFEQKILNDPNAVSVHIRRGDYLKPVVLEYHGLIPERYYMQAMDELRVLFPDATWYVFSDDPLSARELFAEVPSCYFIEGNDEDAWKDMALMAACKHHIIANSSFSWWGAWLSKHAGITIAPKNWFNPAIAKFNINDFIPSHWHIRAWDE
jgi:hypothetical protein